jgi:hypothetical protein
MYVYVYNIIYMTIYVYMYHIQSVSITLNKKTFPSFKTVMHRFLRCVVPPVQWAVNRTLSEAPFQFFWPRIRYLLWNVIIYYIHISLYTHPYWGCHHLLWRVVISWALTKCSISQGRFNLQELSTCASATFRMRSHSNDTSVGGPR